MPEVFAGFVCGFALVDNRHAAVRSLGSERSRRHSLHPKRCSERHARHPASVPIVSFFFLVWTGIGLVLRHGAPRRRQLAIRPTGFGCPNLLFTVFVVITAFIIFMPFFVLVRSARRLALFLTVTLHRCSSAGRRRILAHWPPIA